MTVKAKKVTIWLIVDEFRNTFQALWRYSVDKKKPIDYLKLLKAPSTKYALKQQDILGDAEIDYISAIARAESESNRIVEADSGQTIGKKLDPDSNHNPLT